VSFLTNNEGDVSMNKGVGACLGTTLSIGDFNSAVTHEIGHTLGFRHSDKSRSNDVACSTLSTYDCSSAAIMTAAVTAGLNGALSSWDQHAVETLYAASAPATVSSVVATAISGTSVQLTWSGSCSTACHVYRSEDNMTYTKLLTEPTASPFTDTTATAGKAYLYKILAFDGSVESADSNVDLATTVIYTNTITAGTSVIQAVDTNQMRDAIDAVRTLYGIGPGSYTFGSGSPSRIAASTVIHALDVNEMRTNLNTAINGLFATTPTYTNTITGGVSTVQAIDFNEIRNVMK